MSENPLKSSNIGRMVIAFLFFFLLTSPVNAQVCDEATEDEFRQCIGLNVTSCAAEFPNCNTGRSVITVAEMVARADELCCDKTRKRARKKCLRRQIRQFKSRTRNGELKSFNREVINNLRRLRNTKCDTDYDQLF